MAPLRGTYAETSRMNGPGQENREIRVSQAENIYIYMLPGFLNAIYIYILHLRIQGASLCETMMSMFNYATFVNV